MRHHVLLKLGEELLGFGQGEPQLFEPLAVLLQHRDVVGRVCSLILRANDELHLQPHVAPSPLSLLTMQLTLPSVKGYPRFLMPSKYTLMPQPQRDDRQTDPGLQQMGGRGVSNRVRR